MNLEISHEGSISKQLVGINHNDLVELEIVLTNAYFEIGAPQFSFNTRTVSLISTLLQRQEAIEAEMNARHKRTKVKKSIFGVVMGIVYGFLIGLAVAFVIQLKACFSFDANKEDTAQKASQKPMIIIMVIGGIAGGLIGYYNRESSRVDTNDQG